MCLNVVSFGLSEEDGCDCDGTLDKIHDLGTNLTFNM